LRGSLAPAPVLVEGAPEPHEHVLMEVLPRPEPDVVRPDLEGDEAGLTLVDGVGLALEVAELDGGGRPTAGAVTQDALGRRVLRVVLLVLDIPRVLLGPGLPLVEVGPPPLGRGRGPGQSRRNVPCRGLASLSGGADPRRLGATVLRTRPAAPSSLRTAFGTRPAPPSIDRRAFGTRPAAPSIDGGAFGTRPADHAIDRRAFGMRPADHAADG